MQPEQPELRPSTLPLSTAGGGAPRWNRAWGLVGLVLVALLMAARAPEILREPRFWAEEGTIYFQRARHTSFLEALFYNHPPLGYFSLGLNLATTLAANAVSLAWAPAVTTGFGFAVQLVPFAWILLGDSLLWSTRAQKILAALALLLAPMTASSVWCNSTNISVWAGLVAFVLAMERWERASRLAFVLGAGLLAACCLTGPYALFLLPVFALKARSTRVRRDVLLVGVELVVLLVQGGVYLASRDALHPLRQATEGPGVAAAALEVLSFHAAGPILGTGAAIQLKSWLLPSADGPSELLTGLVSLAGIAAVLGLLWRGRPRTPADLAVVGWVCVSLATVALSLDHRAHDRYAVLPGWLLSSALVASIRLEPRAWRTPRSLLCLALLVTSIGAGAVQYRAWPNLRYTHWSPHWRAELVRWREDHSYRPRIWPGGRRDDSWSIEL